MRLWRERLGTPESVTALPFPMLKAYAANKVTMWSSASPRFLLISKWIDNQSSNLLVIAPRRRPSPTSNCLLRSPDPAPAESSAGCSNRRKMPSEVIRFFE